MYLFFVLCTREKHSTVINLSSRSIVILMIIQKATRRCQSKYNIVTDAIFFFGGWGVNSPALAAMCCCAFHFKTDSHTLCVVHPKSFDL